MSRCVKGGRCGEREREIDRERERERPSVALKGREFAVVGTVEMG